PSCQQSTRLRQSVPRKKTHYSPIGAPPFAARDPRSAPELVRLRAACPEFVIGPAGTGRSGGFLGLLSLCPGFAVEALGLLATLLQFAETTPEAGIADPDYGTRIADTIRFQSHRGRIVGDESAHQPHRQSGTRDRFQFAATRLLF